MDDLNERAATEVMGWVKHHCGAVEGDNWMATKPHLYPVIKVKDFNPLDLWRDAGRLVEEIHRADGLTQKKFEARLNGIRLERNYLHRYLWLTPALITRAAVEACEKKKE